MKRKLLIALAVLLFLFGLGVLLYPTIQTAAFRQAERREIQRFHEYRAENRAEGNTPSNAAIDAPEDILHPENHDKTEPAEGQRAFTALWEACVAYNTRLVGEQPTSLTANGMNSPALVLSDYGWEQEVFATLSIPSAQIETPLYLGASRSNLVKGGVILGQTSLPIGGKSTHCVIGGHRTWNGILHPFVSLEQVQIGDLAYVTNPWETLTYRVISTKTISPNDLEQIRIQPGKDLLSIFTCTYPNTRRVLVTCERIYLKDFYQSIPREVLYRILARRFRDQRIVGLTVQACECFGWGIGLGVGPCFSQILALAYTDRIDHYIKEKLRIKGYVRYGDDGIIIHQSKDYLKRCLARLRKLTGLMGLQFNWKKTHVIRLSHGWRWLKIRWWMDNDGKVVKKLNPEVVTHYRQKFKKLRALLDAGETTRDYIAQLWHCWTNMTGIKHRSGSVLPFNYNCHFTRVKMADLYHNLFAVWEGCPDVLYQTACGW